MLTESISRGRNTIQISDTARYSARQSQVTGRFLRAIAGQYYAPLGGYQPIPALPGFTLWPGRFFKALSA